MVWLKASFLLWTGAFVGGLQLLWVPGCTVAVVVAAGVVHVFASNFAKWDKKESPGQLLPIQPLFSLRFVYLTVTVTPPSSKPACLLP